MHKVKIVSLLLLSLLIPQAFYGLWTLEEETFAHASNVGSTQNIVVVGSKVAIERESWLLDMQYPVDDYKNISSGWGQRTVYGCQRCSTFHQGVDFTPGRGANVYAAMDGVVAVSDIGGEYGVYVILEHYIHEDLIYHTVYAHLKNKRLTKDIYPGQNVSKGDIIGYVGNTGLSTGPHLHFEIRVNGDYVDPLRILQQNVIE